MPTIRSTPTSRRSRVRGLALAGVVALGLVAAAPVAQAENSGARTTRAADVCPSGHFCLWAHDSFNGMFWSTANMGTRPSGIEFPHSVWNRMGTDVRTYSGPGGTGSWICWNSGAKSSTASFHAASIVTMTPTSC